MCAKHRNVLVTYLSPEDPFTVLELKITTTSNMQVSSCKLGGLGIVGSIDICLSVLTCTNKVGQSQKENKMCSVEHGCTRMATFRSEGHDRGKINWY